MPITIIKLKLNFFLKACYSFWRNETLALDCTINSVVHKNYDKINRLFFVKIETILFKLVYATMQTVIQLAIEGLKYKMFIIF